MRQQGVNLRFIYSTLVDNELHETAWFIFAVELSGEGFMQLA